ncbi:MAG: HAMP domain-containing histidine kinase [Aliidiomarina sp.]|uniref:ATP-binding protein n=1 Tax=Aliidiomarina sp. TaxID=1872439 RepID=UPI0025C40842|nr:HAMP domain-containing sensor histidine kinase [Aliidiomarina sp.]MCH8501146.1 HAMP domain-containing histidine kinase [Aliidiomarina sp.]
MRKEQQATKLYIQFLYVVTMLVFIGSAFFYRPAEQEAINYFWLMLALLTVLTAVATVSETKGTTFAQVIGLTALWVIALSQSGGATSPANALLLILLVIAFLQLKPLSGWLTLGFILIAQGYFLILLEQGAHGHAEHREHYLGMGFTFILAAILLSFTLRLMRTRLERSQQQLQQMRESQLRREQIVAMATVSAQFTHDIATPLAMLSLLHEELQESFSDHPAVQEMREPLARVRLLLDELRAASESLHQDEHAVISVAKLQKELRQHMTLSLPADHIECKFESAHDCFIHADSTLLPALLNLVRNAAHEVRQIGAGQVVVDARIVANTWQLRIRNPNFSLTSKRLNELSQGSVSSDKGLGIGLLLSHATLERMGGTLKIILRDESAQGAGASEEDRVTSYVEQYVEVPLLENATQLSADQV